MRMSFRWLKCAGIAPARAWLRAAVALLVCTGSTPAPAVEVADLYEASVPVQEQTRESWQSGVRLALAEVLIKVSGRSDVLSMPNVGELLEQANRYVQQFRYEARPTVPAERDVPAPGAAPGQAQSQTQAQTHLWVRFDEKSVADALRARSVAVWGRLRAPALVWLAVEDGRERALVGSGLDHEARLLMEQRAQRRGLPLRFPLLDLTDRSAVRVSDVWGDFREPILQASQRYDVEAVLVGRLYREPSGVWRARWSLYQPSGPASWDSVGGTLAEVTDSGVDGATGAMAARFAALQLAEGSANVLVRVNDVHALADYARVTSYLESLGAVVRVEPYLVEPSSVIYRISTQGGASLLAHAISLGTNLVAEAKPVSEFGTQLPSAEGSTAAFVPDLTYRLLP